MRKATVPATKATARRAPVAKRNAKGDEDNAGPADFRTRVAADKRARMRERLLDATIAAYAGSAPGVTPVIDDVIRVAGVSRGSFYKYFQSLDEILPELGQRMAEEMVTTYEQLFGDVADPAVCAAGGPLLTLSRAAMEPARVAFTSRVDFVQYFARDDLHGMAVKARLLQAREAGALRFESLDAAIDFAVGAALEGARRVMHAPGLDPAYVRQLTVMVLRGLGMSEAGASRAADKAWQLLMQRAAQLPWWQSAKVIDASGRTRRPMGR